MIDESILKNKTALREWIEVKTDDPAKYTTLERQIFAFYLLEKLIKTRVEFIFKGGTALILLLETANRFSTDIDILISKPNLEDLEKTFNDIAFENEIFFKWDKDIREDSTFPKAHYRFYFNSEYKDDNQTGYILLDCVFEQNPYLELVKREIRNSILPTVEGFDLVSIPSITDIMIDKLTAFAPNTIGVKFERKSNDGKPRDRSREVIKQWFDINEMYQKCTDFTNLFQRYQNLAAFEIRQRGITNDLVDCLKDSLNICLIFLAQGQRDNDTYLKIRKGIRRLNGFVNIDLTDSYFITAAVNVAVLISKVLCDDIEEYTKTYEKSKEELPFEDFAKANNLKKIVALVKANNTNDRDRFVLALRVIYSML